MAKTKIGFIGGGGITGAHLPTLAKNPDVELVGVADVNPAAKKTAEDYGMPHFVADYKDLLPHVDAVLICIPTYFHADAAIACLEAGKAVFCEKPLTRTQEQADAVGKAVAASGQPFQVGFVRRFDKEWLTWRDSVQAGKVGSPVIWHDRGVGSGPPNLWFNDEKLGGGPLIDGCIHNYDFALHTFGPAEWAFCHAHTLREGSTAIDTGTATIHFKSGDELMLAWSWGLPQGVHGQRVFEFHGPKGLITWPGTGESFLIKTAGNEESVGFPKGAISTAFADQMDEFVQVARGEAQPRAGFKEGKAALELALAVLQSGRTNQVVRL